MSYKVTLIAEVLITVELPHPCVDTETIEEVAISCIRRAHAVASSGSYAFTPRINDKDPDNSPIFHTYMEIITDPEIEDDDRDETPEEFDPDMQWWEELTKGDKK